MESSCIARYYTSNCTRPSASAILMLKRRAAPGLQILRISNVMFSTVIPLCSHAPSSTSISCSMPSAPCTSLMPLNAGWTFSRGGMFLKVFGESSPVNFRRLFLATAKLTATANSETSSPVVVFQEPFKGCKRKRLGGLQESRGARVTTPMHL
eukprot:4772683-Amphidinium_carterae.1